VPRADGQPLRINVSAGCAVIDPAEPTREALTGRADVALFKAKRAGRNQVVVAAVRHRGKLTGARDDGAGHPKLSPTGLHGLAV
jgi:predicted signal transduction protein with EAL and GGDEF domain